MTISYWRNQSRVKGLASDTPTMRAAANLVIAVKDSQQPDMESLDILADAFLEVFGGVNPKNILGGTLGLVPTPGAQKHYGFTPSDVVSAYIELERRRLGNGRGALTKAKKNAAAAFVDLGGVDVQRSIERDWSLGKITVSNLSDYELRELLRPYET